MPGERLARVDGSAVPLRGHNIDTDRILPARFLRSVSFEGLERHLFEDDRAQAGLAHPFSNPAYAGASLLFVEANFGCGSSREHAPQAIRRRGIRAVVGVSFSEIFFGNAVALGLPCVSVAPEAAGALIAAAEQHPAATFSVRLDEMIVSGGGLSVPLSLAAAARESFLEGTWDATALLLDRFGDIEAVADRLPYLNGWRVPSRAAETPRPRATDLPPS
jgi:3-isopropylmalate/(R)-2-methylmalate dehydratase small subunit